MPVYEYRCNACSHEFEEWQKISDEPVKTCPKCKKKKVERLISATSFHLKGGGWYKDLYSSKKAESSASGDDGGSAKAATETKTETKAEAKADTKAETKTETKTTAKPAKAESGGAKSKASK